MRNHRYMTLTGSAVAACVAIAAFLFVMPRHSPVEAATILNSFSATLKDGFRMTFENLGDDGVRVDGEIIVQFQKGALREILDKAFERGNEPRIEAVYFDARVRADDTSDEIAGMDLKVSAGIAGENRWAYLRMNKVPPRLLEEQPIVAIFVTMLRNGVLLELGDLLDEFGAGMPFMLVQKDKELASVGPLKIVVGLGEDEDEDEERDPEDAQEDQFKELIRAFLSGKASGEHIEQLVALIEENADDVKVNVRQRENGLHVLTASGFDDDEEFIENMVIEIAYREGVGIEWAKIDHVGKYDGNIRFELSDDAIDADLLSGKKFRDDEGTTVIDLDNLKGLIKSFGGDVDP